ncbi:MAG: RDD family protein [bacterium]|nr:RDD family protein [bacterium]
MKNKNYKIPYYILASKNIRFLNFIIDIIFLRILRVIIYSISAFIHFDNDYNSLLDWLNSFDKLENILLWTLMMFLYYAILEIFLARTLAKYITNTIVVMDDGTNPKLTEILARTLLRLVPFEYFTFLQGRKLGLHDEYSKTYVVKKDKLEKSITDFNELALIENSI